MRRLPLDETGCAQQHPTLAFTQRLDHGMEFNRLRPALQPTQTWQPDAAEVPQASQRLLPPSSAKTWPVTYFASSAR